ncbi:hypothetical protein MTO96_029583 [Rhipicephalus appendiculatus]
MSRRLVPATDASAASSHSRLHGDWSTTSAGTTRKTRPQPGALVVPPAAAAPVPAVSPVPSADVPALEPSPVATPTDDSRQSSPRALIPVIPAADGPAGAASPPREATPSRASSPSSTPTGTRPVTPASAPLSPSSSESPSPSDPDIGQVEDEAEDDPDTDTITDLPPDNTNLFSEQAVTLAAETVRLPPTSSTRASRPINPDNAADIQRLYRRNRRRAIRLVVEGPSRSCDIPLQDLQDHWASTWAERAADTALLFERPVAPQPVDTSRFTAEEVLARLRKAENTAPGSDRLTYRHWKSVDPEARFLSALFNAGLLPTRTGPFHTEPYSTHHEGSGAGDVFTALIADLYRDNRTRAAFNLVVDPVLRRVQGDGDAHNILAYADDLAPPRRLPQRLQQRIDLVESLATPLGLALNPRQVLHAHVRSYAGGDAADYLYRLRRYRARRSRITTRSVS